MTHKVYTVVIRMGHRYGHEMIVAGVPLITDFHLMVFLTTATAMVVLFVYEMTKDGVL